jgi:hypothetical protein
MMYLDQRFCRCEEVGEVKPARALFRFFRIVFFCLLLVISDFSTSNLYAQASAGAALRFGSTNAFVQVPPNTNFNRYPFTVSAWFRTTNGAGVVQGIASKYTDGSGNGWTLVVQNSKLRGFYYRSFANFAIDATSTATVSDGFWHHAALMVDASGGKLFLDGAPVGASAWTGAADRTTSADPLLIGRYSTSSGYPSFSGDIDEVAYWNRALGTNELNYLKHRQLNGNENGLVGLWHLDDGSGSTTVDATGHGFSGALSNSPVWVTSTAPLVFNSVAGSSLSLNGVNQDVTVASTADLNAYPLTITAWVKTSRTAANYDAVVNKYASGSGNGYSLHLFNGHIYAFYFRGDGVSRVYTADPGLDGGVISDGNWHHVAFTVGATGGKIYVDGVQRNSLAWSGSPGASTSAAPVTIGQYPGFGSFAGQIDETSIWNRELTPAEILAMQNLHLAGSESNLVAYWRFDEGAGTSAVDFTGLGHTGSLINGTQWTGSTAFLGDGTSAIHTTLGMAQWTRRFAIQTSPGQNSFTANAPFLVRRLDDFGASAVNTSAQVNLQSALQGTLAGAVPLVNNTTQFNLSLPPYNAAVLQAGTGGSLQSPPLPLQPQPGVQLDSVNDSFQLGVTETYSINSGPVLAADSLALTPANLLHFNGHLFFGPIDAVLTNLANAPAPGVVTPPAYVQTQVQISPGGAFLAIAPGFIFGGGVAFNVNLGANGYATNLNGIFSLANATQFFETNGVRYRLPGASLNASGLTATSLEAWFPAGFGVATGTDIRAMTPFVVKTNIVLGPDLLPTTPTVTFTAASYGTNRLYFAEDSKPLFIGASQIDWHIQQGEFYLAQADSLKFVRQQEDDDLTATQASLVVPLAAERISNDEYYHNVAPSAGVPVYIRADANGAALLTMQATLQTTDFRPHFPYLSTPVGGHIPIGGGVVTITNDLIDATTSYISLSGPVPVPYARDCPPEGGCSGAPTIGPQVLSFTPSPGHGGFGELAFTPDGGLLADGTIPAANLTWGFAGGTNYCQRTSDVSAGAYHVPGTYLRGDQTQQADSQRPAVLLFTGWGQPGSAAYSERPYSSPYDNGLANYAGLNFRAPATGLSFIAGMNAGPYPLTARSKYYVRYGGVSGIHESASFPANLALYGYAFTFQTYRLSYLDSANWESRTDGQVALPFPSAFNVEFQRMKFLCRGNLDSAQLPANISAKHLAYWNADLKPLTLQFKPATGDPCSLTTRYLVLGVETKLPFIPQAFQAALAFKNNGNLANDLTMVEGVDSRFAVPANLSLQGSGGSFYPLTTAAEGYFNNWETPGRPANGFYNLVGRVRVPFFRDVKVQLHVTPTTADTAQIAIMGGWPAEDGSGVNRGWNNGAQNYFNTFKFDPNHDGWPTSLKPNVADYRNSGDESFHPRAQQNWIDVAIFDYPLAWNSVLREFAGFATAPVVLPVIDVDSQLKELTPGKVDLDFAQDLNLSLPRVKVLDFANDALNELNAPLNSVSSAIQSQLGAAFNTSGLTSGFRGMQKVLRENPEAFFRPLLEPALDPVVDKIYTSLAAQMAVSGKATLVANAPAIVTAGGNGLQTAIMNLNGSAGQAGTVFNQLGQTFASVDDTLGLFGNVLEKDGGGNRHVVGAIVQNLTQDQGPALGFSGSLDDSFVTDLVHDLEPTLANIETQLTQLRTQSGQLRGQLNGGSGDFVSSLNTANHSSAALTAYLQQAGSGVATMLAAKVGPAGDYFTADPARAKREIREQLVAAFLGSSMAGAYQTAFRQFLSDPNAQLTQLTDVLFDQVNNAIREGLTSQIAGAQDGAFKSMKGGGAMSGSLLSAKIRGAPTFEGDSLRRIHLDAAIQMNLPDEMNFTAYMDIKELNSATTPVSCIPPGAPAAEVTIGARDVSLDWLGVTPGEPLKLSVEARWTLQSGNVLGVGGSFDVNGKIGFKGCSINDFGATLAFGQTENYFAAKAGATVLVLGIPVDFTAGIFAGKACSLDPLRFIDPSVEDVLIVNASEFTGVYLQFGGSLSLSDILFGTSSCVLDVGAHFNSALYYQGGPRFGSIGGRQAVGVDVSLICIISASADWATAMRLDSAGILTVQGSARLCGKIGACPFCLKACETIKITGIVDDGGIDYKLDF